MGDDFLTEWSPVPDDRPVPAGQRDRSRKPIVVPHGPPVPDDAVPAPVAVQATAAIKPKITAKTATPAGKRNRSSKAGRDRPVVSQHHPKLGASLEVRRLARARLTLRRAGIGLLPLTVLILVIGGIIESNTGDDDRALGNAIPELWSPRILAMLPAAAGVLLLFSLCTRFLPHGREAAQLQPFLRRARPRGVPRSTPSALPGVSGPSLVWEILAGLAALGTAVALLVVFVAHYDPSERYQLNVLRQVGLPTFYVVSADDNYGYSGDEAPLSRRSVVADPNFYDDVNHTFSYGTVEQYPDAQGAREADLRYRHEESFDRGSVLVQIPGGTANRRDDDGAVDAGIVDGRYFVSLTFYGYTDSETRTTTAAGDERLQHAQAVLAALAANAPDITDLTLPWWK